MHRIIAASGTHRKKIGMIALALADPQGARPTAAPVATRHTARELWNCFGGCRARILLAEDNAINQQVAAGIFKKLGIRRVDFAANGLEAIRSLEMFSYDLVFMDVQMPEMDGLEATRCIRSAPDTPHG